MSFDVNYEAEIPIKITAGIKTSELGEMKIICVA